jgi:hypothetical protein
MQNRLKYPGVNNCFLLVRLAIKCQKMYDQKHKKAGEAREPSPLEQLIMLSGYTFFGTNFIATEFMQ